MYKVMASLIGQRIAFVTKYVVNSGCSCRTHLTKMKRQNYGMTVINK